MSDRPLVLTVDDDPDLASLISAHVANWGYASAAVHSAGEMRRYLDTQRPSVLLMDVMLGDEDGAELVGEVRERLPDLPVIMITRNTSLDLAVHCMKRGAADFITKPLDFNRVKNAVADAVELDRLERQLPLGAVDSPASEDFGIVGGSAPIRALIDRLRKIAAAEVSALILGETGTGKELVARGIHAASARAAAPFVPVNAAAIPRELIESALFGHEQGAFTGAARTRTGCCEQADGGVLFLDEIGEMDFDVQAKLLRFLQDHVVQPVGAATGKKVDVRVVAATNIDPAETIRRGRLREDLYYRLRVVTLRIPPLRERGGDIDLLADHFLKRAASRHGSELRGYSPRALEALRGYAWPGNVRELEHAIEEIVVLGEGEEVSLEMLPAEVRAGPDGGGAQPRSAADWTPRERQQRDELAAALEAAMGNPEVAAQSIGISRATIYRRIKKFGLADRGS